MAAGRTNACSPKEPRKNIKNVSGRKSDVLDCQWLQQLMSYGLLHGAFRPTDVVCVLRSRTRQRDMLLRSQSRHVQHMQKALTQMNIQLANVISDIAGDTGQKILRAIITGERDGRVLAAMKDRRIRASEEEIAKSLQASQPWADTSAGCVRAWINPKPFKVRTTLNYFTAHGYCTIS